MTQHQALKYLACLIEGLPTTHGGRRNLLAMKQFAKEIGVPFDTVYSWYRTGRIPTWRLSVFNNRKINARRPKAA